MESVGFCLRVQALEGYADKVRALVLPTEYTAVLAVKHNGTGGENPHYHVVIRTSVKPQAFRVRMKTTFSDGKGNEHMSIKAWDGDNKALSYLFHEEPDCAPIALKNINDLDKIREQNKEVLKGVAKSKDKSSHKLLDIATEHFKALKQKRVGDVEIARFMFLHALRNDKYPPQAWLCKAMVIMVQFRLLDGSDNAEEEFALKMAENIFRTQ